MQDPVIEYSSCLYSACGPRESSHTSFPRRLKPTLICRLSSLVPCKNGCKRPASGNRRICEDDRLNEWMNEWLNGWRVAWMNQSIHESITEWLNNWTNAWLNINSGPLPLPCFSSDHSNLLINIISNLWHQIRAMVWRHCHSSGGRVGAQWIRLLPRSREWMLVVHWQSWR